MSYRKSHVKNKVYKIRPKKSIFKKLWFWVLLLIAVAVSTGFYFVLFYPGFQINNIVVLGNDKVNSKDLQKIVLENSNTGLIKFWNINITSSSIFLLNQDDLYKEILKQFPIIEKLRINVKFPQTVSLGITERKPLGVYCGENQKCFLVDENGIVFEDIIPNTVDIKYPIVRQALENKDVYVGEQVIGQSIIIAVLKIQKDLNDNFQIDLREALVTSPIRLNVTTSENWKIYFDLEEGSDINSQIIKLNLLLEQQTTPDSRENLQYIDLRPKDRAIICDNKECGGK